MLIAGAVGFGFTLIEDFVYSSGLAGLFMRLPNMTVHMMLGLAMGQLKMLVNHTDTMF